MGNIIQHNLPQLAYHTLKATRNLQVPDTVSELRLFLGPCNFICQVVSNLAKFVPFLSKLLKKTEEKMAFGRV